MLVYLAMMIHRAASRVYTGHIVTKRQKLNFVCFCCSKLLNFLLSQTWNSIFPIIDSIALDLLPGDSRGGSFCGARVAWNAVGF